MLGGSGLQGSLACRQPVASLATVRKRRGRQAAAPQRRPVRGAPGAGGEECPGPREPRCAVLPPRCARLCSGPLFCPGRAEPGLLLGQDPLRATSGRALLVPEGDPSPGPHVGIQEWVGCGGHFASRHPTCFSYSVSSSTRAWQLLAFPCGFSAIGFAE